MLYNVITKTERRVVMKDKLIQIRADAKFFSKLEYLRSINGFKSTSETIRKIVEKEWKKEYCINDCERCVLRQQCESSTIRGEWVLSKSQNDDDVANGNYTYVCTNCQHTDIHAKTQRVPYCWYCGAKMSE